MGAKGERQGDRGLRDRALSFEKTKFFLKIL
jgi:hypothetical protein